MSVPCCPSTCASVRLGYDTVLKHLHLIFQWFQVPQEICVLAVKLFTTMYSGVSLNSANLIPGKAMKVKITLARKGKEVC